MVSFQQKAAYGRDSGVYFGPVDVVQFAQSMGAHGMHVSLPEQVGPALRKAMDMDGPVIVGIPVDYRDNESLMAAMHPGVLN